MGDCFTTEIIDLTTTHLILPNDDPHLNINLHLILGLIYGWFVQFDERSLLYLICSHLVTFDWLKSSSRIGEWLRVKKFEPKRVFQSNPSLTLYRKCRQEQKSFDLFNQCGLIYLTSLVSQRSLLLKLITLLGGNVSLKKKHEWMIEELFV